MCYLCSVMSRRSFAHSSDSPCTTCWWLKKRWGKHLMLVSQWLLQTRTEEGRRRKGRSTVKHLPLQVSYHAHVICWCSLSEEALPLTAQSNHSPGPWTPAPAAPQTPEKKEHGLVMWPLLVLSVDHLPFPQALQELEEDMRLQSKSPGTFA